MLIHNMKNSSYIGTVSSTSIYLRTNNPVLTSVPSDFHFLVSAKFSRSPPTQQSRSYILLPGHWLHVCQSSPAVQRAKACWVINSSNFLNWNRQSLTVTRSDTARSGPIQSDATWPDPAWPESTGLSVTVVQAGHRQHWLVWEKCRSTKLTWSLSSQQNETRINGARQLS